MKKLVSCFFKILKCFKSSLLKTYNFVIIREIIKPPQFNETMTQYIMEMKAKRNKFFKYYLLMFTDFGNPQIGFRLIVFT